jgi:hypothetical protein
MTNTTLATALVAAAVLAATTVSAQDRGLQFSPDGKRVLVNKDVGSDRFALTLNQEDGTALGNVFRPGEAPAFIACSPLPEPNRFACSGADACSTGGTQRGIQASPDGKRILVNKDVNNERFAITLNDDGTATGNVFREGGGPPAFLVCNPLAGPNQFACFGADACPADPCTDQFSFVANVTLPGDFFTVPAPCPEPFSFIANVTLPPDFFRHPLVDDLLSGVETDTGTPGSLEVGVAPIPGPGAPSTVGAVQGSTNVNPGGTNDVTVPFNAGGAQTAQLNGGLSLIVAVANQICAPGNFVSGFYQIPLQTTSGQVSLTVSFSETLRGNQFVLCIATVNNGVVSQYVGFQQQPSVCGNDLVESGEACDPPAAQSQCGSGQLCSNNCLQCVSANSCMGRCCPGRDDSCTATGAQCFCDEFCVTANDCCTDALSECGFGSVAPRIFNRTHVTEQLNSCQLSPDQPLGSLFAVDFDFEDADGDVTPAGAELLVNFTFLPNGTTGSLTPPISFLSGTAADGRIRFQLCSRFDDQTTARVTLTLFDAAENASNPLTFDILRPQGAN